MKELLYHCIGLILHLQALAQASAVLVSGGDRLRKSQEMSAKRTTPDFHMELFKLRQNWRLKKVGGTILGDLSYKSGG